MNEDRSSIFYTPQGNTALLWPLEIIHLQNKYVKDHFDYIV